MMNGVQSHNPVGNTNQKIGQNTEPLGLPQVKSGA
jgi:hypothetical protein